MFRGVHPSIGKNMLFWGVFTKNRVLKEEFTLKQKIFIQKVSVKEEIKIFPKFLSEHQYDITMSHFNKEYFLYVARFLEF